MLTGTAETKFKLKTWLSALTQKQQQQLYQYLAGVAEAKAVSDLNAYAGALNIPVDNHRADCIPAPPDSVDIPPVVLRDPVTVLMVMDQTLSMRAPSKVKQAG